MSVVHIHATLAQKPSYSEAEYVCGEQRHESWASWNGATRGSDVLCCSRTACAGKPACVREIEP